MSAVATPANVRRLTLGAVLTGAALALHPAVAAAQCRPGEDSNEAKLLAHYSAPITFAPQTGPGFGRHRIILGADLTYIPKPDPALERTGTCFMPKKESTQLSPVFPRPRLSIGLPLGIGVEIGYLPPVRVAGAKANLLSGALSITRPLVSGSAHPIVAAARIHATRGYVNGAITCSDDAIQQTDPNAACYGSEKSNDTFRPNMWGIDGSVGRAFMEGRLGLYAGGGYTWLAPRFRVGFDQLDGFHDRTRVEVDLQRASVFGGATYHLAGIWSATAQVYSVPVDVTLFRLGATARLGRL
jgi:hypothetical protein